MIRACWVLPLSGYRDDYSDYDGDIDVEHPIRSLANWHFNSGISLMGLSRLNHFKKQKLQFYHVSSKGYASILKSYAIQSKYKNSKPSKCLSDFRPIQYVDYGEWYKSNVYGNVRW